MNVGTQNNEYIKPSTVKCNACGNSNSYLRRKINLFHPDNPYRFPFCDPEFNNIQFNR